MPEPTPVLPEVLAQIDGLAKSEGPLIICDVDEVVLHLILHLESYLADRDLVFLSNEFRLTGNIAERESRIALPGDEVRRLLDVFFADISHRQKLVPGADTALAKLSRNWDIVLLTNLPGGANKPVREKLLADFGIAYPLVANSGPKGGAVAALAAGRQAPVVFIDDSPTNHASVAATLPASVQIQFVADPRFRVAIRPEPHVDLLTGDWQETEAFIEAILDQ
ncbi:hypothetical protein FMN50_02855 [Rhodobacterales bacterium]|nr:hypothetical protein FMN50_02855 [Rhodobacterales bacterium]